MMLMKIKINQENLDLIILPIANKSLKKVINGNLDLWLGYSDMEIEPQNKK